MPFGIVETRAGKMRKESPVETLYRFTKTSDWIERSSLDALAGDLLVGQAESKLQWFTCVYEENNNKLYSPVMEGPIVGTEGGVSAQEEFNNELQDWFLSNDEGLAVGISPKGGKFSHPDDQIQIYRIAYELILDDTNKVIGQKKSLLCAFHQFDFDFNNPEVIRRFIFPQEDTEEGIIEIIKWLKGVSKKKVEESLIDHSESVSSAYYYAEQLKNGVDPIYVFNQMDQSNFLGSNSIGCASVSTFSNTTEAFHQFGKDQYGSLEFKCPSCKRNNTRPFGQLIPNCLHCGADVSC